MTSKQARGPELSERAQALVELARERQGHMSPHQLAEGERTLRRRLSEREPSGRRGFLRSALPAAAVLLLGIAIAAVAMELRAPKALTFTADQSQFRFSDGTEVLLLSGAKGHIESIDQRGARLRVEDGAARVQVVHRPGASWLFDVGPFLITVKGTTFVAEWSKADERLTVRLEKGNIAVDGPLSDEPVMLHGGQKLTVRLRERETLIRDLDAVDGESSVPPASPLDPEVSASKEHDQLEPGSPSPSPRTAVSGTSWSAELAQGKLDAILEEAERRGLDTVLRESSSEDLAALADAARYRRRDEVGRQALLAQRRRFARSSRAHDAAFLLGRLEESHGDQKAALGWYQRYLDEAPSGTYASECLGRKMIVVQRSQGDLAARSLAEEYLRRFPSGAYAATARSMSRTP